MMKYNLDLIKKYINDEITDKNITKMLENDKNFMLSVIEYSNCGRFYFCASLSVMLDYDVIKYAVENFYDDIELIHSMTLIILKHLDYNNVLLLEFMLLIIKNVHDYDIVKGCTDSLDTTYFLLKNKCNNYIKEHPNDNVGRGFILYNESLGKHPDVQDWYAKKELDDIMRDDCEITLENQMHEMCKNIDEINNLKMNSFLINYVSQEDSFLASYLSVHKELLDDTKKYINDIVNRWDLYEKYLHKIRHEIIKNYIVDFLKQYNNQINFNYKNILLEIVNELNLSWDFKDAKNDEKIIMQDVNIHDIIEIRYRRELKTLIKKLYEKSYIIIDSKEEKNNCKVININRKG